MPHEKAYKIALGNINIYTMEKFADFDPDTFVVSLNYIEFLVTTNKKKKN
jgi:hypothetical protein